MYSFRVLQHPHVRQVHVIVTTWSVLSVVYRIMDARGKFGEHERSIQVARGVAESISSFLIT